MRGTRPLPNALQDNCWGLTWIRGYLEQVLKLLLTLLQQCLTLPQHQELGLQVAGL